MHDLHSDRLDHCSPIPPVDPRRDTSGSTRDAQAATTGGQRKGRMSSTYCEARRIIRNFFSALNCSAFPGDFYSGNSAPPSIPRLVTPFSVSVPSQSDRP